MTEVQRNEPIAPSPSPRRRLRWSIIGAIGILVVGAVVAGATLTNLEPPVAEPTAQPTPGRTDVAVQKSPASGTAVRLALVGADIAAWQIDTGADVRVRVGGADDLEAAVSIMSDRAPNRPLLSQTIAVTAGTAYDVTIRSRTNPNNSGAVAVRVGDELNPIASSTEWSETTWTFSADRDGSIPIEIKGVGALDIEIDSLSIRSGETEYVVNGEFREFAAAPQISNDLLIMQSGSAYVGVVADVEAVDWIVRRQDGTEAASGTSITPGRITLIQLSSLPQGFYVVELSGIGGELPRPGVSIAVLDDYEMTEQDARIAFHAHIERPYYAGAAAVAEALGGSGIRAALYWQRAEYARGEYTFAPVLDSEMADYSKRGIDLLPIISFTNPLYDNFATPSTEAGITGFANYGAAIVRHFGVDAVEVYSEFNHGPFNNSKCGRSPECYMQLLGATAAAVRAVDPGVKVVGPANALQDDEFLTGLYRLGGLDILDAVSYHPYEYALMADQSGNFMAANTAQATQRIAEYGGEVPIWITELGWSTATNFTEAQQAEYLVQSEVLAFAGGVERFYWYDLVNDELDLQHGEGNFGLVRQKVPTIAAFEPKPAAGAQAVLARMIQGRQFVGSEAVGPSVNSHIFGENEAATRVVWSTAPASVQIETTLPIKRTDLYGFTTTLIPTNGQIVLEVGGAPFYLQGDIANVTLVE